MNEFLKALESSQGLPELPEQLSSQVPDILAQHASKTAGARRTAEGPNKVPMGTEYDFDFNSARLMFGNEIIGYVNGNPNTEPRDDADRYKEIMDKVLRAEAVLQRRQETFLKDGTVVIFLEWLEPKQRAKEEGHLTYEELISPETPGKDPDDSEETSPYDDSDD